MAEEVNRRDFVKGGAAAAALTGITFITKPERVFGANDRVRIVTCGVHGRGKSHISAFGKNPNSTIAGICDPDEREIAKCVKWMDGMSMPKPKTYTDVRKLLDDKSIDAISIATPNHWHSLMAIWACQAGKDVYCREALLPQLVGRPATGGAPSKKYDRIVQHGTNGRSAAGDHRRQCDKMREGLIGDVYLSRGLCYKWRDTIGTKPASSPCRPASTTTCGPAPRR